MAKSSYVPAQLINDEKDEHLTVDDEQYIFESDDEYNDDDDDDQFSNDDDFDFEAEHHFKSMIKENKTNTLLSNNAHSSQICSSDGNWGMMLRIANGKPAKPGKWRWQIYLERHGHFVGGGTLINSRWVLTAAHVLKNEHYKAKNEDITVYAGIYNRKMHDTWTKKREVAKIFVHHEYNTDTNHNDIALIKLAKGLRFSSRIKPIAIPKNSKVFQGRKGWATGWGSVETNGYPSDILMENKLDILTNKDGLEKYRELFGYKHNREGYREINLNIQLVAGGGGADTCTGDSGGPLVYRSRRNNRWYLVGITSFGPSACGNGGVYTRVSAYLDWIKYILKYN